MVSEEDEGAVERMARAICLNEGYDPNERVRILNSIVYPMPELLPPEFGVARWEAYVADAKRIRAAYLAMMAQRIHDQPITSKILVHKIDVLRNDIFLSAKATGKFEEAAVYSLAICNILELIVTSVLQVGIGNRHE